MIHLHISFRILSRVRSQPDDCPSASQVTLKYMGKLSDAKTHQIIQFVHVSWNVLLHEYVDKICEGTWSSVLKYINVDNYFIESILLHIIDESLELI